MYIVLEDHSDSHQVSICLAIHIKAHVTGNCEMVDRRKVDRVIVKSRS